MIHFPMRMELQKPPTVDRNALVAAPHFGRME
jgi:hypothetical protein